jgi:deazaflavin-dependent oxidoreductase (nitroreductase family)
MAKSPTRGTVMRLANAVVIGLVKLGFKPGANAVLTVPGRKSGLLRSTPITVVEYQGRRYVQSPYGEVDWVRNLRAAGKASLQSGRRIETVTVRELNAEERAPILQVVLRRAPKVVQRFFEVTPDSPLEAFVKEAPKHPMFELEEATSSSCRVCRSVRRCRADEQADALDLRAAELGHRGAQQLTARVTGRFAAGQVSRYRFRISPWFSAIPGTKSAAAAAPVTTALSQLGASPTPSRCASPSPDNPPAR